MNIILPFILAMFLAINMGGSGVGPSFSVAFGANAIKRGLIPGLFGIMVFLGALGAGDETAATLGNDIIAPKLMTSTQVSIILFSVSVSLLVANLFGIPQSTSQSAVLAIVAPGILFDNFSTNRLFLEIVPTWLILPIISFAVCYCVARFIYNPIKDRQGKPSNSSSGTIANILIVAIAMYVAFSIGSNNVANASGPLVSMVMNELGSPTTDQTQMLITMMCAMIVAPCFGIGGSIFGDKILRNNGKQLYQFGKGEALLISFVSASLLLGASLVRGIPTSLVQLNVGAIMGVGTARIGFKAILERSTTQKFFIMWLVSPAIAFALSLALTWWLI